jgi:hypothetical protein
MIPTNPNQVGYLKKTHLKFWAPDAFQSTTTMKDMKMPPPYNKKQYAPRQIGHRKIQGTGINSMSVD